MRKKVYIFLAEGFEEVEALSVVDVLRRAGVDATLVSITEHKQVTGAHAISIMADRCIHDIQVETADAIVLPGGLPGATNLEASEALKTVIRKAHDNGALLAAICAAPVVYGKMNYLRDKHVTCYPSFEQQFEYASYEAKPVVVDLPFITGRGPAYAFPFALSILEHLLGKDKAKEVADGLLLNE